MTQPNQKGRRPDYILSAKVMPDGHRGSCGAGWVNPDGSITVKLAPWVVLEAKDGASIRLFPNDRDTPYADSVRDDESPSPPY